MRIALVCNPVAGGWSPLEPEGWAGGEEIVVKFSEALAARKHIIHVAHDGQSVASGTIGVPCFLSREDFAKFQGEIGYDLALYFKCPELYDPNLAPRSYLWTDQERCFVPDPFVRVVACSEYLRRWIASAVPRALPRLSVIPYGIDCAEVLAAGEGITRDPLEVLHCASPDRGLDVFLDLWPRVLARVPEAKLTIAYGWELFDKYGGSPALKAKIQAQIARVNELAQREAVTMRRLSRLANHQALHRASVYAYWCTGGEQFGLTALKAQLAGCVPVVKPWGALHETIMAESCKVDGPNDFVAAIADRLSGPRGEYDGFGLQVAAERFDWPRIVDHWEALWSQHDQPPAPLKSAVVQVPGPPPFAEETGWNLPQAAHALIAEWMQAIQPQRPWIDPTLGYPLGPAPTPADADAILLGWSLEDDPEQPGRVLRRLCAKPGTPVFVLVSHGAWRATKRQRAFAPADLQHLLGACPEFTLRAVALNGEGDGATVATCRFVGERIPDDRDLVRVRRIQAPRETLSACFIVRDVAHTFPMTLKSLESLVDEVCVIDTGSTDATADVVDDWRRRTGIAVRYESGTSPRFCFDCQAEHAIGEMGYGHRVAGFETPRNQSVALARGDHVLWCDADEELLNAGALAKYLRPNTFAGYGIPQHHHSVNPPEASKVDYPVRCFRRVPEGTAGWLDHGPEKWPTYHSGCTARFTGVVHEHPGHGPTYTEGLGPVIILSDVWISHRGYTTEDGRRRRFVRNWPLMVADRQKYPDRRLGLFLMIRDLSHQARYLVEAAGGQMTPDAQRLAQEGWNLYMEHFVTTADAYSGDAAMFANTCAEILGAGIRYDVSIRASKPELSGEDAVHVQFSGRFENDEQALAAAKARMGDTSRWQGPYV
jgi:glycosyltransferase involved in cell wall biosynthesis